jgi:hypothetical protein
VQECAQAATVKCCVGKLNTRWQAEHARQGDADEEGAGYTLLTAMLCCWCCVLHCMTEMGTEAAERSAEEGPDSVLHPWLNLQPSLNGSFTRDGLTMEW